MLRLLSLLQTHRYWPGGELAGRLEVSVRWAEVTEGPNGHCAMRIRADSPDWAVLALGTTGADFRVTGPPEFTDHLAGWASRLSRVAAGTD